MTMQFKARILTRDARLAETGIEALDLDDARMRLREQGHVVVSVHHPSLLARWLPARTAPFPLLAFTRELLALVSSGISIVESIETLAEKENRAGVRSVLMAIHQRLHQGLSLADALARQPGAFPSIYVATVRASERTGGLEEALGRYVAYASALDALRARLVQAAIYPALLLLVGLAVILFLLGYVVPRFSHIYADVGGELPWMSAWLLQAGSLVEAHGAALLATVAGLLAMLASGAGPWLRARLATWAWHAPALGERLRVFALTRLYRTLGLLLRGGVPLLQAMGMLEGLLPGPLAARLGPAVRAVSEGVPMSVGLQQAGLATPVALRMMRVGERAGNMGEMLERIAAFHDEEMARWAEWVTRLLGPVLMLLMGLVIGTVVVLMYLPIFQLADAIR